MQYESEEEEGKNDGAAKPGHNRRLSSPGSRRGGGGPQSVKSEGSRISFSNPANGGGRDIKQEI